MKDKKIVIVTGAAQGLGKAICTTLACKEYTILMVDLQEEKLKNVQEEILNTGCDAVSYPLNLCKEEEIADFFEFVERKYGSINILINNAGADVTKPVTELSITEWDKVVNTNLRASFIMSKFALQMMKREKSGHIINIISTAALRGWTEASAYHASKWGLRGFSQALFTEARRDNIKVSAIIAGGMRTAFLLDRFPDLDQTKLQEPLNVAKTIQFILSQPEETTVPEVMVLPLQETSWP